MVQNHEMDLKRKTLAAMVAEGSIGKEKIDSCYEYIIHLESNVAYAKHTLTVAEEDHERATKELEQFKSYLANCLDGAGGELKGEHKKLKFRKPSYKVKVNNEDLVPSEYKKKRTISVIDLKKAKEVLKNGEIIEGLEYVEGKKSLLWGNS